MITKTARHPSGCEIYFDADAHRYHDSAMRGYDSVTQVVKSLFQPFDAETISAAKGARDGVDPAALRAEWKAAGEAACEFGTRVHAVAEDSILARTPRLTPRTPREKAAFRAVWNAGQMIREKSASVHPEVILADPESATAGMADLIAIRSDKTGLVLADWKTWKVAEFENKYGRRALPPYGHIHDCNVTHAALQLSIYSWVLRQHYFRAEETITLVIGHIAPDAEEVSWLSLPDLSREADQIMQARRADVGRVRALAGRIRDAERSEAELAAQLPDALQDSAS